MVLPGTSSLHLTHFRRRCRLRSHKGASTRGVEWERGGTCSCGAPHRSRSRRCWSSLRLQPGRPRPSRPTRRPVRVSFVRILRRRLRPARSRRRLPAPGPSSLSGGAGARGDDAARPFSARGPQTPRPVLAGRRARRPHADPDRIPKLELPPVVVPAFVSSTLGRRSQAGLAALALALAALTAGSGAGLVRAWSKR